MYHHCGKQRTSNAGQGSCEFPDSQQVDTQRHPGEDGSHPHFQGASDDCCQNGIFFSRLPGHIDQTGVFLDKEKQPIKGNRKDSQIQENRPVSPGVDFTPEKMSGNRYPGTRELLS